MNLDQIERFLLEGMPVAAMAHSYHVQALADPEIGPDPIMQRFSLIELNELHHQVAALGDVLRLRRGDQSAAATLGYNLSGFLQNRQLGLQVARQFPPAMLRHPAVQRTLALTEQSNEQIARNWPLLQRAMAQTAAAAPGPLLVHNHP